MQSNIFTQKVHLLEKKNLNIDCQAFANFLDKYYKAGQYIYPDALYNNLKIGMKSIYEALELYVDEGLICQCLEIYCPNCQRFANVNKYKSVYDIPDNVYCVHCDMEIESPIKHAIVIYKVL